MNYTELSDKIKNDDYDSKLPFPPFRPIRREHEEADKSEREKHRESDRAMKDAWHQDEQRLKMVFKADLKKYAESELGKPITDEQFDAIFHQAWEDGHSSGYHEVLIYADNIIEVVKKFV